MSEKNNSLLVSEEEAVQIIQSFQHNPDKFIERGRGYVDWKFSEVAQYIGYPAALQYVESMTRWWDYETRYRGQCLLDISYQQFKIALDNVTIQTQVSTGTEEIR